MVQSMIFKFTKDRPYICQDLEFVLGLDIRVFFREVNSFTAANWRAATHKCEDKVSPSTLTGEIGLGLVIFGVHDEVLPRDQEVDNEDL